MSEMLYPISVEVNGVMRNAQIPARLSLVDWLRDELRLTGTHVGCEHGVCGACSIMLNDEPVRSCLMYAVQADGHCVTTVEGLAKPDGSLSVLQDSFCQMHGLQCGYCTPGMLIAAHALLNTMSSPTDAQIREAIGGNLCRCTGYQQIVDAVMHAAERLAAQTTNKKPLALRERRHGVDAANCPHEPAAASLPSSPTPLLANAPEGEGSVVLPSPLGESEARGAEPTEGEGRLLGGGEGDFSSGANLPPQRRPL